MEDLFSLGKILFSMEEKRICFPMEEKSVLFSFSYKPPL